MSLYSKEDLNLLLGIENTEYDIFEKINFKMKEEVKWIFGTILYNTTIILISSKGDIIFFFEFFKEKFIISQINDLINMNFSDEETVIEELLDDIFFERRFNLENIELTSDDIKIKNIDKFFKRKMSNEESINISKYLKNKCLFNINKVLKIIILEIDKKLNEKLKEN
jgi:hypothetical protein